MIFQSSYVLLLLLEFIHDYNADKAECDYDASLGSTLSQARNGRRVDRACRYSQKAQVESKSTTYMLFCTSTGRKR